MIMVTELNDTETHVVPMLLNDTEKQFEWTLWSHSIVYTTTTLTGLIVIVNSIVLYTFLQKKNRSPLTILLSWLAFTDAVTAISLSIPEFIFILSQKLKVYGNGVVLWYPEYPYCMVIYFSSYFGYTFHQISVLLTAILSVQKTFSMVFPIWSKIHLTKRVAAMTSLMMVVISVFSYTPLIVGGIYRLKECNEICCLSDLNLSNVIFAGLIAVNVEYILCMTVTCVCTIIVFCKLTCLRTSLQWIDTPSVQKRNRRSAIIVVIICIIFILSEVIPLITWLDDLSYLISPQSSRFHFDIAIIMLQYNDFSLLIGFSLNFIVYLAMGQHLRKTLITGLRDIYTVSRCCE